MSIEAVLRTLDDLVVEGVIESYAVGGVPVRIACAEHLAAIALATGRAKDKARLLMFLEHAGFGRSRFEGIVQRHGLGETWTRFVREFQVR